MSAKVTLIGQPQSLRIEKDLVSFRIVTGPASNTAPKGLLLFQAVTYVVNCSQRQFNRGRANDRDKSELVIEGYQEPRVDNEGKPYIAVVALSMMSKHAQGLHKLEQLREETIKAEETYAQVCDQFGDDSPQALVASQSFETVKAGLLKFMSGHPELKKP
jgi:hypothetical protein